MNPYRIVCEENFKNFEIEVNKLLEKGYTLYGNPFSTEKEFGDNRHQYYNQVLIIVQKNIG